MGISQGERNMSRRNGGTYTPPARTGMTAAQAAAASKQAGVPVSTRGYAYTPNPRNDPANWADPGKKTSAGYPDRVMNSDFANPFGTGFPPAPPYPPTTTSGGGSGRRGGGGSSGPAPIDTASILALLNRKPQSFAWQNQEFTPYVGPEFYNFDTSIYDTSRTGLTNAVAADRTAGNASYAQLGQEMANYQNPWTTNPSATQNPAMSAAMQRMMQANNVNPNVNQADINQGVQADQAFGNLGTMLGAVANQEQQSRLLANQGYQRGFNERLDAEQRGGMLSVDMQQAAAKRQYDQDKWTYGESVARKNYDANMANIQYNNQGQNQVAAQNTQAGNDWQATGVKTLLDLIAAGQKVDPALLAQLGVSA